MPSSDLSSGYMSSDRIFRVNRIFRVTFRGKCIIISVLQMREQKLRKSEQLAQGIKTIV